MYADEWKMNLVKEAGLKSSDCSYCKRPWEPTRTDRCKGCGSPIVKPIGRFMGVDVAIADPERFAKHAMTNACFYMGVMF